MRRRERAPLYVYIYTSGKRVSPGPAVARARLAAGRPARAPTKKCHASRSRERDARPRESRSFFQRRSDGRCVASLAKGREQHTHTHTHMTRAARTLEWKTRLPRHDAPENFFVMRLSSSHAKTLLFAAAYRLRLLPAERERERENVQSDRCGSLGLRPQALQGWRILFRRVSRACSRTRNKASVRLCGRRKNKYRVQCVVLPRHADKTRMGSHESFAAR